MSASVLSTAELLRALALRDLSDPAAGPHAMQLLLAAIHSALPVAAPLDAEHAGDLVRSALGDRAELVEAVEILSTTPYDELPAAAIARLGIAAGQWNVLVRVTLRALGRTLTHDECNVLLDDIYAALHAGSVHHWASRRPAA